MCNKFAQLVTRPDGTQHYLRPHYDEVDYEIARLNFLERMPTLAKKFPGYKADVIFSNGKEDVFHQGFRWGVKPHWSKELINCTRSENLFSATWKPFIMNRCIIPIECFYEWKEENGLRIPFRIRPSETTGFYLAGIFGSSKNAGEVGADHPWFSILTQEANLKMREIHNSGNNRWRQPVLMEEKNIDAWLERTELSYNSLLDLIPTYTSERIVAEREIESGSQMNLF
ncbi:SOS response-associated peptidase family protein [Leptospira yasudae]|uniref:SOS response-associated peptidase n=1 Tax=Leptospira yasudae TaxID=2202201 RepID=UPI001C4FDDA0|nr:SOS response-associated peptidase family protein [Leptospira yasudae]MBW0432308.1 SOS response-associated peptidase family protein [Leptospira yasudae]